MHRRAMPALEISCQHTVTTTILSSLSYSIRGTSADSLRVRLRYLVAPLLRLVITVLAALPDSANAKVDAVQVR